MTIFNIGQIFQNLRFATLGALKIRLTDVVLRFVHLENRKHHQPTIVGYDRQWIRQHIGTGLSDMAILYNNTMHKVCSIISSPPCNVDT